MRNRGKNQEYTKGRGFVVSIESQINKDFVLCSKSCFIMTLDPNHLISLFIYNLFILSSSCSCQLNEKPTLKELR